MLRNERSKGLRVDERVSKQAGGIPSEPVFAGKRVCVCVFSTMVAKKFRACLSGGEPDDDDWSRQGRGLMNET